MDEVVPDGDLVERALVMAGRLARRPKTAIAAVKRAVYLGGSEPLAAGLRRERAEFLATITSPGAKRAMAAYVERFKSTGELLAYDRDALERALEDGVFD